MKDDRYWNEADTELGRNSHSEWGMERTCQLAAYNGMRVRPGGRYLNFDMIGTSKPSSGVDLEGNPLRPLIDHPWAFRVANFHSAYLLAPYPSVRGSMAALTALRIKAMQKSCVILSPPNVFASTYLPGGALQYVVVKDTYSGGSFSTEGWRWLPVQLSYPWGLKRAGEWRLQMQFGDWLVERWSNRLGMKPMTRPWPAFEMEAEESHLIQKLVPHANFCMFPSTWGELKDAAVRLEIFEEDSNPVNLVEAAGATWAAWEKDRAKWKLWEAGDGL